MFRIFGPPGTGKTTKLLDMVDKALGKGMAPQKIAFLAFTRKAAHEKRSHLFSDLAFSSLLAFGGARISDDVEK